jgi:nucleotide-binding universal stress UspA family protein
VDFSPQSAGAVRYAKSLARHFHSDLILLHVLAPDYYQMVPMDAGAHVPPHRQAEARRELEDFMSWDLRDLTVTREVIEGDPAPTIVEYAHREKVSLIAMPTHGYGPFRRFLLGSVTAKVLHDADCPVLTGVHLEEAPEINSVHSGSIVCALDLGPHSDKVLDFAALLAGEFDARLTLVHAIPRLDGAGEYFDPNWRVLLTNIAQGQIATLQENAGTRAEVFIESGDTPRVVRCAAQRFGAGLLVIGRGSAAGIFGRLRTNAYAIIRESPCPVVSV